ncbi:MAG: hypothetical protein HC901_00310 [Bdellovibrionaceae bacterium]|nr:hypothetical protein [Pseudobdellovibrionaceae bacterium]
MNPILEKVHALAAEGFKINAVGADRAGKNRWRVWIDVALMLPLGEGGEAPHHKISVNLENLPKGISVSGFERYPRQTLEVVASDEGIESLMQEVAREGRAQDCVRFDGAAPDYPHFLTKPNKWN